MPRDPKFFLTIAAMTVAAVAGAILFDSQAPILVWFAATLAFESWWQSRKSDHATSAPDSEPEPAAPPPIRVAQPWIATRGVAFLWSGAAAALLTFFAQVKGDISLLGVPYWIPLGPAIIGNIGPRGLWLGQYLFGSREPRLRSVFAYAILTMVLLYIGQYLASGQSYAIFMAEYFTPGGLGRRTEFASVAPVSALTPLVQLIGCLIGGAILKLPTSRR